MQYKIGYIEDFKEMDDEQKLDILKEIVKKSFYNAVEEKTMWGKILNNYIKPTIKKLHPRYKSEVELEIVS